MPGEAGHCRAAQQCFVVKTEKLFSRQACLSRRIAEQHGGQACRLNSPVSKRHNPLLHPLLRGV
jgi:hypothetical protein